MAHPPLQHQVNGCAVRDEVDVRPVVAGGQQHALHLPPGDVAAVHNPAPGVPPLPGQVPLPIRAAVELRAQGCQFADPVRAFTHGDFDCVPVVEPAAGGDGVPLVLGEGVSGRQDGGDAPLGVHRVGLARLRLVRTHDRAVLAGLQGKGEACHAAAHHQEVETLWHATALVIFTSPGNKALS